MTEQRVPARSLDASARLDAPRVRSVACLCGVSLERDVPCAEIHDYIRDLDNLVWVDVQDPGPAELAMLEEEFGFHPLALEDAAQSQQRPKVDEYKGYVFVVTYTVAPVEDARHVRTLEVDLFIGRNYLVSLHRGRIPALDEAYTRWMRGGERLREGVGFLVYTVMDAIIDAYAPVLAAIEDELEETQLQVFAGLHSGSVQSLLALKRSLVTLRRVLNPLREAFHLFLRRDRPLFTDDTVLYLHDVYNHILRILDALEVEREMAAGALDAYLAVKGDQLNTTMKILTVVSLVFGIAGCVFEAWGSAPLAAGWRAWAAVVGGTAALSLAALVFSWRRGWL